jgi:hypothetical protein
MPRIIISCPTSGEDVPTGYRGQDAELAAIVEPRSFRCPVCNQVHAWRGADARIEGRIEGGIGPAAAIAALPT